MAVGLEKICVVDLCSLWLVLYFQEFYLTFLCNKTLLGHTGDVNASDVTVL